MREEAKTTLVISLSLISILCLAITTINAKGMMHRDVQVADNNIRDAPVGGEIKIPTHLILIRNLAILTIGTALAITALTRKRMPQ